MGKAAKNEIWSYLLTGGPIETRSTHLNCSLQDLSGIPHLTRFSAAKYAPKISYLAYLSRWAYLHISWSTRRRTCFHTSVYLAGLKRTIRTFTNNDWDITEKSVHCWGSRLRFQSTSELLRHSWPIYTTRELSLSWQSSTGPKKSKQEHWPLSAPVPWSILQV